MVVMKIKLTRLYDELSTNEEIQALVKHLNAEWNNRNTFPMMGISMYSGNVVAGDDATKSYSRLIELVRKWLEAADLSNTSEILDKEQYLGFSMGIFHATKDGQIDFDYLTKLTIVSLLDDRSPGIDEYVESMNDVKLLNKLGLSYDKEFLVELQPGMELRHWALILDSEKMVYPHQFLRRGYSANFVGTPALLSRYRDKGVSVKLRIDPFRLSTPRYYREYMEADYWHGKHFSTELLMSKEGSTWTKHATDNFLPTEEKPLNPMHPIRFTIFRSKMMDDNLREFMIEEYVPLVNPLGGKIKLPGFGKRHTIQKFGHLVYNQQKQAFVHFDTAIRAFSKQDYETAFSIIESGKDPGDKLGDRYKLYLIEGEFQLDLVEPLMYDFFMYNPHIEEYFFTDY